MQEDLFANMDDFKVVDNTPQGGLAGRVSTKKQRTKPSPDRYRTPPMPPASAPTPPPAPRKSAAPMSRAAQKKKNRMPSSNPMGKKIAAEPQQASAPKGSLFRRLRVFFKTHTIPQMWIIFLYWVSRHVYVIPIVAAAVIIIGMFFSRYISCAGALIFVGIGAALSKEDLDTAGYVCYGAAFADFIIPYLL